ncbi:MAG TPA: hypothetical protein ENJ64_06735, partial [Thiotrichales bacterium]|nr:hypothetical protein [Thiotrichales bacterium]
MEPLRWILLVAGIAFVFFLYLFGRKHYQRKRDMDDIELDDDDLPEFNARNWDDFDEGVGPVRVITGAGADPDNDHPGADKTQNDNVSMSDIIVMYILPKLDNIFPGSQINSSVQAMGLKFGEMNIYHFKNGERTVFSLANMHEPGHFDPNTIHDMKSTGLTVFMQINT